VQDGLIELGEGQRHTLLQCIACYQVKGSYSETLEVPQ
jgi:hypothetical protein